MLKSISMVLNGTERSVRILTELTGRVEATALFWPPEATIVAGGTMSRNLLDTVEVRPEQMKMSVIGVGASEVEAMRDLENQVNENVQMGFLRSPPHQSH